MSQIKTIRAEVFEETIDGYFPLRESLRQMLVRNRIDTALVRILHAPAMEIPGLKPQDPVPLFITDGYDCMIHQMTLIIRLVGNSMVVSGAGQWTWTGEHRVNDEHFSAEHRLAEPAFVRGLQLKQVIALTAVDKAETTSDPSPGPSLPEPPSGSSAPADESHHILLQTSLIDNCIVKGECSAIGSSVFIKPFIPVQIAQESISYLVFEKEPQPDDLFTER